jgi:hypothetical protein
MTVEEAVTYPVKLVGDVAKHDSGANITTIKDALTTDAVVLVVGMAVTARATTIPVRLVDLNGVGRRSVLLKAAHGVDVGLVPMRGVHSALAEPSRGLNRAPLIGLLYRCQ